MAVHLKTKKEEENLGSLSDFIKQNVHMRVSWGLPCKPLGPYLFKISIKTYLEHQQRSRMPNAAETRPATRCSGFSPLCQTTAALGIHPGEAGHAIRAQDERQPAAL